ncbi:MAG: transglycosylase domain-containing protein [Coriobacteriia bacterium]|nr:transglycosylase domain-containing protein [Coriobacteriia bacterium]
MALLAMIVFAGYMGAQGVMGLIQEWEKDLPSVESTSTFNYSAKTRIYASDRNTLLAEFYLEDQEPVALSEVSTYVSLGTVATEDVRFYEHNGVDLTGIARALLNNLMGGDLEGASTITQQLVRNTLLADEANDISLKRKVREAALAMEMEKTYTKDEILQMYLNTINYGDGCYGIQAASKHYFQKNAKDLTIVEAATLVGIPQSPTYNSPVEYPDNCLARRNLVLNRMLSYGVITQAEYEAAVQEPLVLNIAPEKTDDGIQAYPYFTSYVRQCLVDTLSFDQVFSGGLTVYTTIDPSIQAMAEEAAAETYEDLDEDVELAMTCVNPENGYIVAMIGGRDYSASEFNLATNGSGRQAGSSFKPFTLATAIEKGISPQSTVDCGSKDVIDGWSVENYDAYDYGIRSIERATWVSSNTGYAHLITDENGVTPEQVVEMAARMGVSGDESNGFGAYPALTLGVAQVNTTMMAGAYATFAADGVYHEPTAILMAFNQNGEILIDNTKPEGKQVISPEVSYAVTQVLEGVVKYGTATQTILDSGQVSAGKTGTSENWRDLWFCGYTPQWSCSVWTGADPERELYEASWSKDMWKRFMTRLLDGTEKEEFTSHSAPTYDAVYNTLHPAGATSNTSNTSSTGTGYSYDYTGGTTYGTASGTGTTDTSTTN